MTKAIIFDFDGTVADSFNVFVETLEEVLSRPTFTKNEIEKLRGLSIPEILRALQIRKWQIPKLIIVGRREVENRMGRVEIFKDMPSVLRKLSSRGYKLYILSSNSETIIRPFLEKNKIDQYIDDVYGDIGLFSKAKYLTRLCRDKGYKKSDCIYIGDEVRDAQAARRAGIECISVAWGYSNAQSLKTHNPHNIASSPQDLLKRFS